ncbi:uncharacterized protein B4U79_00026 [Dinothrombium tinctorium]|uniref:Helitron helicase-like domain-containing protein n=1 Tax=Dinothrombium tinctorium TaxID=1965070 RepID=A0A3S3S8S2_9ACAR|nr:uncharacterized protein B4U79_00026 [Dinothrombium tinctorium]
MSYKHQYIHETQELYVEEEITISRDWCYYHKMYDTNKSENFINSDDNDEEEPLNPGGTETLLNSNFDENGIAFAPGELSKPLALLSDSHVDELSFPTIYCGQKRKINVNLSMLAIAKSELRNYDRRSSPSFWERKKKEVFAMIRQLGHPTLFMTFSAAETKWPELIIILSKILDEKILDERQAIEHPFQEKARLIRSDPVTCARYFDHRFRNLLNCYFTRRCGSPHIHGLFWLKNSPIFSENNNKSCIEFINQYITVNCDILNEDLKSFHVHRHTKSCKRRFGNKVICRFGFPQYPMRETQILLPLDDFNEENTTLNIIHEALDLQANVQNDSFESFDVFLQKLNITEIEYITAIPNMDIQSILDPYACVQYVLNYISKSERGMSSLLRDAVDEVKKGNYTIRERLRFIGNKFINCSEVSAQEAVYHILSIPMSNASKSVIFINTSPFEKRERLVMSSEELRKLDPESTEIFCDGLLEAYFKQFNQLPPVGNRYVFQPDPKNPYLELIGSPLWDKFRIYTLDEIMRQKDDLKFARCLNNIAVGEMTSEDIELIMTRIVNENEIPNNAIGLLEANEMQTSQSYGLPYRVLLRVEARFMISVNIDIEDGLVNGATGILKLIKYSSFQNKKKAIRLWLLLDSCDAGTQARQFFALYQKIRRNLSISIQRQQFPVVPAEAITIHKSQGGTYQAVAVHLSQKMRRSEIYVACSRVTKLSGLYLTGKFMPPKPPSENDIVKIKIARM